MRTEHKQSHRQPLVTLRGCEAKWLLSVTQEGRPCILSSSKFEALKVYFMTFKNSSQWLITASKAPCKTQWFFIIFDCSYKSMSNCQCRFIRKFSLFRQLTWIDHIEILTGVLQTVNLCECCHLQMICLDFLEVCVTQLHKLKLLNKQNESVGEGFI